MNAVGEWQTGEPPHDGSWVLFRSTSEGDPILARWVEDTLGDGESSGYVRGFQTADHVVWGGRMGEWATVNL